MVYRPPAFVRSEDLEGYAKGRHGDRMGFGRWPAVVVVDFTRAFVDPTFSLAAGTSGFQAVLETRRVLDAARALGAPVVFTRPSLLTVTNPAAGSISRKRIAEIQRVLTQPGANDLMPELGRREDELILEKTGASGFFGTDLVKILVYHRADTVIVAGAATSGCVRATVIDAASYNYFVIVPQECVSDRSITSHEMNLFEMDQKYADVVGVEDVLRYLQSLGASADQRQEMAPISH